MITNVSQIKVTLPDPLYEYLNSRAGKFGMTMSSYVKNLILNDVKDMEFPVFEMGEKTEASGLKAIKEHEEGKTILVKDVDEFFASL